MIGNHIKIPVKPFGGENWAMLNYYGPSHIFVGEKVKLKEENFSFYRRSPRQKIFGEKQRPLDGSQWRALVSGHRKRGSCRRASPPTGPVVFLTASAENFLRLKK